MRDASRLASGDKILCPHCEGWHTVRADIVANTEYAVRMLFFECRGGRYYTGQIGDESRYPMMASEPFTGLGCPACRQPVADIETEALDTLVFRCQACGHRWASEATTRPH